MITHFLLNLLFYFWDNKMYYNTIQQVSHCFKVQTPSPNENRIVGYSLEKLYAYRKNIFTMANNIISNRRNVLDSKYKLQPSDWNYEVPWFNKVRMKNSFVHHNSFLKFYGWSLVCIFVTVLLCQISSVTSADGAAMAWYKTKFRFVRTIKVNQSIS